MSLDDPKTLLQIYRILSTIRPFYEKTEFPYNLGVQNVIETKKEIDLKFIKDKNFFKEVNKLFASNEQGKKKKGGGAAVLIFF